MRVGVVKKKFFIICFMFWNSIINAPDVVLLEMEDLNQCNANTIANAIAKTFEKYSLLPNQCLTF